MLTDLAGCMGLRQTEVLRHMLWAQHRRMGIYLAANELPPGTQVRLSSSGEFVHRQVLHMDRERVIRHLDGALLLDSHADHILKRLAQAAHLKPAQVVSDLLTSAAKTAQLVISRD